MRSWLAPAVFVTVFVMAPSLALADDAGDGGDGAADSSESPEAAAGVEGSSDVASSDSGSNNEAPYGVIACDGDLCDTLQGRPSCSVGARSIGAEPAASSWLAVAAAGLVVCIARRAGRGASRLGREGQGR